MNVEYLYTIINNVLNNISSICTVLEKLHNSRVPFDYFKIFKIIKINSNDYFSQQIFTGETCILHNVNFDFIIFYYIREDRSTLCFAKYIYVLNSQLLFNCDG